MPSGAEVRVEGEPGGRPIRSLVVVLAGLFVAAQATLPPGAGEGLQAGNWPGFRGPGATGIGDGLDPPVRWSAEDGTNLLWKTPIPGVGHSSPVVWGDRVFVSTAVSDDPEPEFVHGRTDTVASAADRSRQSWRLYCLDRRTGEVLWHRVVHEGVPRLPRHVKGSYANPTPVTDGSVVVVSFGSQGLHAFEMDGEPRWRRQLGVLDGGWSQAPGTHWGFGSSPVLWRDLVIVQADAQNQSWLAAFRLEDGSEAWRTERGEDTSWATPTVTPGPDPELVVSGTRWFRGYDPATGQELWRLESGHDVKIPTPLVVSAEETVGGRSGGGSAGGSAGGSVRDSAGGSVGGYLILLGGGSAHERPPFWAVYKGARGEIPTVSQEGVTSRGSAAAGEDEAVEQGAAVGEDEVVEQGGGVAWRTEARPHVVTPIAYRGYLYVCTDNGILTVYDLADGERLHRLRVGDRGGSFSASPVAADGRLFFAGEDGDVHVLSAALEPELLATNPVGEPILATPALVPGMILVRGRSHLLAFGGAAREGETGASDRPVRYSGTPVPLREPEVDTSVPRSTRAFRDRR